MIHGDGRVPTVPLYYDFDTFAKRFLDPLSRREFKRTTIPLSNMGGWKVETSLASLNNETAGQLAEAAANLRLVTGYKGFDESRRQAALEAIAKIVLPHVRVDSIKGRYSIEGWRCRPDNGEDWDTIPPNDGWDQPGIKQPAGIVAQIMDPLGFALVRAIWEPGNAGRGWDNSSLLIDVSAKHSPGNKALWAKHGVTPPLADFVEELLEHPEKNVLGRIEHAPYDGARDDKDNLHVLLRASREEIAAAIAQLNPRAQRRYALVSPALLQELIAVGLVPIHLRDLLSLTSLD